MNSLDSYIPPFHDCEDISPFKIVVSSSPSSEVLEERMNKLFEEKIIDSLNLLFHLMPEENKRRVCLNNKRIEKLSTNYRPVAFEAFCCLCPDNYFTLQKGKYIARLIGVEKFVEARKVISGNLSSLKIGKTLFIPLGSKGHATVCVIKRVNEAEYELALFNTGFGGLLSRHKARTPVFLGLSREKIYSENLLDIFLAPWERFEEMKKHFKEGCSEDLIDEYLLKQIYKELELHFEKKPDKTIVHFKQQYRTCTTSSLEVAMYHYGSPEIKQKLIEFTRQKIQSLTPMIFHLPKGKEKRENKKIQLLLLKSLES